jgi:hypothetical protein
VESTGAWSERGKAGTRRPVFLMGVAGALLLIVLAIGYVLRGNEEGEREPSTATRGSDSGTLDYDLDRADIADVIPKDGIPALRPNL